MLDVVQSPTARRLWRIAKFLHKPINDPCILNLTQYDMAFYEFSMLADNPKALEEYKNKYFDDEFDEWLEEFDKEQEEKQRKAKEKAMLEAKEEAMLKAREEATLEDEEELEVDIQDDDELIFEPVDEIEYIDDWEEV